MNLLDALAARHAVHTGWRHDLHAHPELAYEEHRTAGFVAARLRDFGVEVATGIGGTGVVGSLTAGSSARSIGLRADMDALPITEQNLIAHRSRHDGVMHACGHDGHVTMLLAAAEYLARQRDFSGTVRFIFQPAEEGEAGAKAMLDDGLLERFPFEAVFGLHNWPGLEVGRFATRAGAILAAMDTFEVRVVGQGGHGALPHQTIDPIWIGAQVVQAWQGIVARNVDPLDAAVVSVTQFHGGDSWAVIPAEVVLRGTVRSFTPQLRRTIETRMQEVLRGLCAAHGARSEFHYEHRFPPTVNTANEVQRAAAAAAAVVGPDGIDTDCRPSTGSEDFGCLLEKRPGCYAVIGNGSSLDGCVLHSPRFDFNDDLIPLGAAYWIALVHRALGA